MAGIIKIDRDLEIVFYINKSFQTSGLGINEKRKNVIKYLWESIDELHALIIIDSHGTILEYKVKSDFESRYSINFIEHIATLVSVRFKLAEIDKLFGGLEMTFNVFKESTMIVKPYGTNDILIMLVKNQPTYSKYLEHVKNRFYSN